MYKLENPTVARAQTLLVAVASWSYLVWLVCLPFNLNQHYLFLGLLICESMWAIPLSISTLLKCPRCAGYLAFVWVSGI